MIPQIKYSSQFFNFEHLNSKLAKKSAIFQFFDFLEPDF